MDLKRYSHADAPDIRSLLLDIHDEAYADDPDPFHSRKRFSYFVDLWSSRENWQCVLGWEEDGPVGYAYGAMFKPGGWWKGHQRPAITGGSVFALSELKVVPQWRGTGRAKQLHDALLESIEADFVTLLVDSAHHKVQALYESWEYSKAGEAKPSDDSPLFAVMAKELKRG
ncbi:GNAT family N-acetyltransferase [Streptomyces sp. NPDC005970]|uniref:GNAT family N-acetyltransferase n=1 Tax=Streptomyces sp. NPDC005970 TaxID=3156723 RepID=UPI0033DB441C